MARPHIPESLLKDADLASAFNALITYYEKELIAKNRKIVDLQSIADKVVAKVVGIGVVCAFLGYMFGKVL